MCRCIKESLPWQLPKTLVKGLVAYGVARINILHTTAINLNVCPKVLFTGIKVNYSKELDLEFGAYAGVYDGADNTVRGQTITCIALYPCNNATGSWEFLNLKTRMRVGRSQWTNMETSEFIIDRMNRYDDKNIIVPLELQ